MGLEAVDAVRTSGGCGRFMCIISRGITAQVCPHLEFNGRVGWDGWSHHYPVAICCGKFCLIVTWTCIRLT